MRKIWQIGVRQFWSWLLMMSTNSHSIQAGATLVDGANRVAHLRSWSNLSESAFRARADQNANFIRNWTECRKIARISRPLADPPRIKRSSRYRDVSRYVWIGELMFARLLANNLNVPNRFPNINRTTDELVDSADSYSFWTILSVTTKQLFLCIKEIVWGSNYCQLELVEPPYFCRHIILLQQHS